jgi:hypothetical protein
MMRTLALMPAPRLHVLYVQLKHPSGALLCSVYARQFSCAKARRDHIWPAGGFVAAHSLRSLTQKAAGASWRIVSR